MSRTRDWSLARRLKRLNRWTTRRGRRFLGVCAVLVVAGGLFQCTPYGCSPKAAPPSQVIDSQTIRVRICPLAEQVNISADEPPVYFTSSDPTPRRLDLPRNVDVPVRHTGGAWLVSTTRLPAGILTIRPVAEGSVRINDRPYRGQFRLVPLGDGRFDLVNDVHIDSYLKGVLAAELYRTWHEETYKAQAIVARTYALYEKNSQLQQQRHWDVYADTRSQVYGGMNAETGKSRSAADATAGVVVAYGPPGHERIFKAYFSSCCGGISQSSMHAFNEPYMPPLSEQNVGTLCSASSKFSWSPIVVAKTDLTQRFRQWGRNRNRPEQNMAEVRSVDIEFRNQHGRPVRFTITDAAGRKYSLSGEEFRWAVNTLAPEGAKMPSSFVENIINDSDRVRLLGGHGHGHGVGLCQWCSQARAEAGLRHEDIVTAAYPGAKLKRAY